MNIFKGVVKLHTNHFLSPKVNCGFVHWPFYFTATSHTSDPDSLHKQYPMFPFRLPLQMCSIKIKYLVDPGLIKLEHGCLTFIFIDQLWQTIFI